MNALVWFSFTVKVEFEVIVGAISSISEILIVTFWVELLFETSVAFTIKEYVFFVSKSGLDLKVTAPVDEFILNKELSVPSIE